MLKNQSPAERSSPRRTSPSTTIAGSETAPSPPTPWTAQASTKRPGRSTSGRRPPSKGSPPSSSMPWTGGPRASRSTRAGCPRPGSASSGRPVGDDWPNFQIDGYGTWLWSLQQHLDKSGEKALPSRLAPSVDSVGRYLVELRHVALLRRMGGVGRLSPHGHARVRVRRFARPPPPCSATRRWPSGRRYLSGSALVDQARRLGRFAKSDRTSRSTPPCCGLCEPFHVVAPDEPAFVETVGRIVAELDFDGGVRRYPSGHLLRGWCLARAHGLAGLVLRRAPATSPAAQRCLDWVADHVDDQRPPRPSSSAGTGRDPEHYREWVARWGRSGRRPRLVARHVRRAGHRARPPAIRHRTATESEPPMAPQP